MGQLPHLNNVGVNERVNERVLSKSWILELSGFVMRIASPSMF